MQLKLDYDAATVPQCLVAEQPVGVAYAAVIVQVQLILVTGCVDAFGADADWVICGACVVDGTGVVTAAGIAGGSNCVAAG